MQQTTQINSAFHPSGIGKSSTSLSGCPSYKYTKQRVRTHAQKKISGWNVCLRPNRNWQ